MSIQDFSIFSPDLRKKIKKDVAIEGFENAWIELYDDLTMSVVFRLEEEEKNGNIKGQLAIITEQIADWNFVDLENKKLDITVDNMARINIKVIRFITECVSELAREFSRKKKELPGT
jgi:hypothetical protein